jgi:hypothetical protein
MNVSQESETKVTDNYESSDILKSLDSLVEETLQIFEFNEEEEVTIGQIFDTISVMLTQIKTNVPITPSLLGPGNSIKSAVLAQDGRLVLTYRDNEVRYRKISEFPPSVLLEIMADLFPKIKNAATMYKKNLEERLTFYRAANRRMKKIEKALKNDGKIRMEDLNENANREDE